MLPLLFKIKETVQKLKFWSAVQKRTGFYTTLFIFFLSNMCFYPRLQG